MPRRLAVTVLLLCPLGAAAPLRAQYVGKVAEGPAVPPLRAVAVYEYTGELTKPNASRLVPVVVWDGTNFQPGGLYKAEPEPLAVVPGTQYVLTPDGVPGGRYNVLSSSELDGGWVGLGRYAAPPPPPPVKKLHRSKTTPVLHGGSVGHDQKAEAADGGPVLHKRDSSDAGSSGAGSGAGSSSESSSGPVLHKRDDAGGSSTSSSSSDQDAAGSGPTLHRRDTDTASGSGGSDGSGSSGADDPDRPRLHEGTESTSGSSSGSGSAPEPDRPLLHRHAGADAAEGAPPPDPGRPRLRYGSGEDADSLVLPTLLKAPPKTLGGAAAAVPIGQMVAISDVTTDEPHPFVYSWPSADAKTDAEARMHALALRELANVVTASFGPAARNDAALKQAADAADASFGPNASAGKAGFGPATQRHAAAKPAAAPDPLLDPEFHAFELSYGGGVTLVYSAHTAPEGANRRFVTVIAQLNFSGVPQKVFAQTTRGDMLGQTPALHLVDAVDAKGDHRAELLFDEHTSEEAAAPRDRQFALFSVYGGQADEVYSSGPGGAQ